MGIRRTTIAVAELEKLRGALKALAEVNQFKQDTIPISGYDLYYLKDVRTNKRGYAGQKDLLAKFFAMPKWGLSAAARKAVMQIVTNGTQEQMYADLNALYRRVGETAVDLGLRARGHNVVIKEECRSILRGGAAVFQTRIYHFDVPQGEDCLITGYHVE